MMKLPCLLAAALSLVFVNLSAIQMVDTHIQLTLVWLCPGVIALGWKAFQDTRRACLWASACALSLAMLFFSTFYIPWFLTFFACVGTLLWVLSRCIKVSCVGSLKETLELRESFSVPSLRGLIGEVLRHKKAIIAFVLVFLIGLIPFLLLYLRVVLENNVWDYRSKVSGLPKLVDYVNIYHANYMWSWILRHCNLCTRDCGVELRFGLPPFTMLFFLFSTGYFAAQRLRRKVMSQQACLALLLGVSVLVCWALMLNVDGLSAWKLVHTFVPGATAIRAIFRFNVVLSMMVLLVLGVFLKELLSRRKRWAVPTVCVLTAMLFCEQLGKRPDQCQIQRDESVRLMDSIPVPPADARAFYVKSSNPSPVWTQITAFLIAQHFGLDTPNGYSGIWPRDWPMEDTLAPDYERMVYAWFNLEPPKGLYVLDLDSMEWLPRGEDWVPGAYEMGENLILEKSLRYYDGGGWSDLESWGVWTNENEAILVLPLHEPSGQPLVLEMEIQAFLPVRHPKQALAIYVNGTELTRMELVRGKETWTLRFELPEACSSADSLRFRFELPDAVRPSQVSSSSDKRLLGIGLRSFKVLRAGE